MSFNNWFTQGVIVNIVTAVLSASAAAAWLFWKSSRQSSPLSDPNITLVINKKKALRIIGDVLLFIVNTYAFVVLPPANDRFAGLVLAAVVIGMIISGASLLWALAKWRVSLQTPPAT